MENSMRRTRSIGSLRQSEHRERSTERGVVAERGVATDGPEAFVRLGQTGCETDTGPTADAGQHGDVLPAAILIGRDVTNDAGRSLELVEFLARLGIDCLEVAFERSVEHHAAGGRERTGPHRELLLVRPDDLARLAVPGDEVAHVAL